MDDKTETGEGQQPKKRESFIKRLLKGPDKSKGNESGRIKIQEDSPFHPKHTGEKPSEQEFITRYEKIQDETLNTFKSLVLSGQVEKAKAWIEKEKVSMDWARKLFDQMEDAKREKAEEVLEHLEEVA